MVVHRYYDRLILFCRRYDVTVDQTGSDASDEEWSDEEEPDYEA